MSVKLISTQGSDYDLSLNLEPGSSCFIGRDPDESQLLIQDPKVSRKHALIENDNGQYTLSNLSKTNPLFVNDELLEGKYSLKPGDKVLLGDSLFHFFDESQSPPPEPIITSSLENPDSHSPEEDDNPYETIFEEFSEIEDDTDINFTESHRYLLKVLAGPNTGAEFPLQEGRDYLIGSHPQECDLIFHDLSVSKQHAKLSISEDYQLHIQDLNSKNGILVEGEKIQAEKNLKPNQLISLGTSTFTLIDQEDNSETLISPSLQEPRPVEETPIELKDLPQAPKSEEIKEEEKAPKTPLIPQKKKNSQTFYTLVAAIALLVAFTLLNIGISLFKTEEITQKEVDYQKEIQLAIQDFPSIEFSFQKNSGELFLQGHVSDSVEKNQLLYQLQVLKFVRSLEEYVIIDEAIAKEHNEIFAKKPEWKSITLHTPQPGRFVISGYLQSAAEAEKLAEYINRRFEFVELLDNQVTVEELLLLEIKNKLIESSPRFQNVAPSLINGELKLDGMIKSRDKKSFEKLVADIQELKGVRKINNFVVEVKETETLINLSGHYSVSGYSKHDNINLNVIINGRILSRGDQLDGMTITTILPHTILLEKDGLKYKIDYKK